MDNVTSQFEAAECNIISVMLDAAEFSSDRSHVERTICENALHSRVWFEEPSWNLGPIIPWAEEKLVFHLSFNGGNMRWPFWSEWVYPRIEQYIGAIFILNVNRPEDFPLTKSLLMEYRRHNIHYNHNLFSVPPVIALTGYDEPSAWKQADIAFYLRDVLSNNPFVGVNPKSWNSVKEMLITSCAYFANFL